MVHERPRMKPLLSPHNGRSKPSLRAPVAIRVDARFEASPERVFNAWLDPAVAARWLFATAAKPSAHVEIDARAGGRFRLVERREAGDVEHRGEYVEIVPHRRLAFTLALADRPQQPTFVIVGIGARAMGSILGLTHENVPLDLAYGMEARWTGMLYGLGVALDAIGGDRAIERLPSVRRGPLRRAALAEERTP